MIDNRHGCIKVATPTRGVAMETHTIKKGGSKLKSKDQVTSFRINDSKPNTPICGLLNFIGQNGDTYTYSCVGTGCITIYLTDCQGNVEAATAFNCITGNNLQIEGCHGF